MGRNSDLPFKVIGVANSDSPTNHVFEDQPPSRQGQKALKNSERFQHLSDELWWSLRLRFKRTYERVNEGRPCPDEDCISIPNNPTLIAQLSQPVYRRNSQDKITVDKYGNGSKSPDYAEAVLYLFAPPPKEPPDWSQAKRAGGFIRPGPGGW
jgi:phage terminase large subunit